MSAGHPELIGLETDLSARWAVVSGVLGDFHLLDAVSSVPCSVQVVELNVRLSEGSTVSGSVLSGNTNLFRSFSLNH